MASPSIYWYDFETFGSNPRRDRASQFAGVRTDEELNIIGEPLVIYCRPSNDFLPNPMASLITGISPQHALAEGVAEAEFIRQILQEFSQPQTCVAGYNSLRFDDEVTRQLLYRNFHDPYEREWKNGNTRWDIIDMVRLCAATRPDGINWPLKEDGSNSFRLEELTQANNIEHAAAHDALSDVIATIELAKLVKKQQPKLFDYVYQLRHKRKVQAEIDLVTKKPVLHISVMYPAKLGCMAMVMPLCAHPENSNGVVVYDLRSDPNSWIDLSPDEIRHRLYTPSAELAEGVERIPLKTIHINRCPVITSPAVLSPEAAEKYQIDLNRCRENWEKLQQMPQLLPKVQKVLRNEGREEEQDPDYMIYSGGFFSDHDKDLMKMVRSTAAQDLARLDLPFRDQRLSEMLFRYRARNFPESLSEDEIRRWDAFRNQRLGDSSALQTYSDDMELARSQATAEKHLVLDRVQQWVEMISQKPAALN